MKSFMVKKETVQRKWLLVDADGAVLGRLASKLAMILMGKTKPTYTRHVDMGDSIIVINAEKIRVTGRKAENEQYHDYFTLYPGGHKYESFKDLMARNPEKVIRLAVRRMLPKNKLGVSMMRRLRVCRGAEHEYAAQKPEKVKLF